MSDPKPRSLQEAVDEAAAAAHSPPPPRSVPRLRRFRPVAGGLAVALLAATAFMGWSTLRDPFPSDPDTRNAHVIQLVDMARVAVEEYHAREGRLPPDLAAVGLEGLPVEYTPGDGFFDIVGEDGWGEPLGYHGVVGGDG